MEEPLDLTTKILSLLTLSRRLVGRALNKSTTASREDHLKLLQRDLEDLEKQVLLLQTNLGVVSAIVRDRRSRDLLRGPSSHQALMRLCGALDETRKALTRLTMSSPDAQEGGQNTSTLLTSGVDNFTLKSMQVDINTCRENLEKSRLDFTEIYEIDSDRPVDCLRVPIAVFTLRGTLMTWLKRCRPGRSRNAPEVNENSENSVPEATSAVRKFPSSSNPSTASLFLQLPTELKLYVLDILNSIRRDERLNEPNPLPALRLTCKTLASICAPLVFRTIRFDSIGLNPERASRRATLSKTLGKFVCNLTLAIPNDPPYASTPQMSEVISDMPNIRSLTLVYEREDTHSHTPIHDAIHKLEHLDHVTLEEARFDPRFANFPYVGVPVHQTFFHRSLSIVLKVHSSHLRTLQLNTLLPLDSDLYRTIRDDTPHLRCVSFTASIDLKLRDIFADPTPWASGKTGSLETLTIFKCPGVEAGNFVRNVLRGTYGTRLKDVKFISSGSDIPDIPPASTSVLASVEHLHFDHVAAWEISALSLIPIQDLSLTRLRLDAFVELSMRLMVSEYGNTQPGFKGLKRLRLNPNLSSIEAWNGFPGVVKDAYTRLREVCSHRNIQLSFDAEVFRDACANPHI